MQELTDSTTYPFHFKTSYLNMVHADGTHLPSNALHNVTKQLVYSKICENGNCLKCNPTLNEKNT